MDARYTGHFPITPAQARAETAAYYQAQQAAQQRKQLANAYLAQQGMLTPKPQPQQYRCERCGI